MGNDRAWFRYGPFCADLAWGGLDSALAHKSRFLVSGGALPESSDLMLSFKVAASPIAPAIQSKSVSLDSDGISIVGSHWRATIRRRSAAFQVHPEASSLAWVIDEACLYTGIAWAVLRGGLVLHSSAVLSQRGALLFAGPSGAGKSTLARHLAGPTGVLSDDQAVCLPASGTSLTPSTSLNAGWLVTGNKRNETTSAPIHRLFFISQAATTRKTPLSKQEALYGVLKRVCIFLPFDSLLSILLDSAVKLISDVECFRLEVGLKDVSWEALVD